MMNTRAALFGFCSAVFAVPSFASGGHTPLGTDWSLNTDGTINYSCPTGYSCETTVEGEAIKQISRRNLATGELNIITVVAVENGTERFASESMILSAPSFGSLSQSETAQVSKQTIDDTSEGFNSSFLVHSGAWASNTEVSDVEMSQSIQTSHSGDSAHAFESQFSLSKNAGVSELMGTQSIVVGDPLMPNVGSNFSIARTSENNVISDERIDIDSVVNTSPTEQSTFQYRFRAGDSVVNADTAHFPGDSVSWAAGDTIYRLLISQRTLVSFSDPLSYYDFERIGVVPVEGIPDSMERFSLSGSMPPTTFDVANPF